MKNEIEELKKEKWESYKRITVNLTSEQKNELLQKINNGEKTGYATIDQPWLQQYKNYDSSRDSKYIANRTIWDVTEEMLEKYSDIPLIEYFGRIISREDFHEYVETWARTLRALGVEKGDYVPLYVPSTPESFAIFFACNSIGAIPYYQKLDISKAALDIETKEAKIAVVFDALWENVSDVFSNPRFKNIIVTSAADSMMFPLRELMKLKEYFSRKKGHTVPKSPKFVWTDDAVKMAKYFTGNYKQEFTPNAIAGITTSSGTTSHVVKGIMDTNESMLASLACTINAETGFTEGKRTLTCLPPTASTSINCLQLLPTFTGGTIIFDPRVDTSLWYSQLMKQKPDITITTGSVWEKFVQDILKNERKGKKHDLSWIDYFIMGGSGTTPEILNHMNEVLRDRGSQRDICVGYGFSEVFGVLSVNKYNGNYRESENKKPVISVGAPLPGYLVGLFDKNGNELPYGTGKRGELWIKAPSNMEGYYGKKELTENTMVDGWIHSGDLCEIDNNGNIYCYGRVKNNIIVNNNVNYLFDLANGAREKFNLYDIIIEKKAIKDADPSLVTYFVQKETEKRDQKEILQKLDEYFATKKIKMGGYKEHVDSLPIDPTTLKPRTKDLDGFKKYKNGEEYNVFYEEVELDVYKENHEKVENKVYKKQKL